jgi:hypothetical protein
VDVGRRRSWSNGLIICRVAFILNRELEGNFPQELRLHRLDFNWPDYRSSIQPSANLRRLLAKKENLL